MPVYNRPTLAYLFVLSPSLILAFSVDRRVTTDVFRAGIITAVPAGGPFTGVTPILGNVVSCLTGSDGIISAVYSTWNCTLYLVNPTAYRIEQVGQGAEGAITDAQCNDMVGKAMTFGTKHGDANFPENLGWVGTYGFTPEGCETNPYGPITPISGGDQSSASGNTTTTIDGGASTTTAGSASETGYKTEVGGGGSTVSGNDILSSIGAKAGLAIAAVVVIAFVLLVYKRWRDRRSSSSANTFRGPVSGVIKHNIPDHSLGYRYDAPPYVEGPHEAFEMQAPRLRY